jgi:hypothetical protein
MLIQVLWFVHYSKTRSFVGKSVRHQLATRARSLPPALASTRQTTNVYNRSSSIPPPHARLCLTASAALDPLNSSQVQDTRMKTRSRAADGVVAAPSLENVIGYMEEDSAQEKRSSVPKCIYRFSSAVCSFIY